jgi:hypothetical protein
VLLVELRQLDVRHGVGAALEFERDLTCGGESATGLLIGFEYEGGTRGGIIDGSPQWWSSRSRAYL